MQKTEYYCDKCKEQVSNEQKLIDIMVYTLANDTQIVASYMPMKVCKKCYNKYASICQIFKYM